MVVLTNGIVSKNSISRDSSIIAEIADRYILAKKNDIAVILIAIAWMIQANPAIVEPEHRKKPTFR
jgi:hypothetical protein